MSSTVAAQPHSPLTPRDSPFAVDLTIDLPVFAGALSASVIPSLIDAELATPHCDPCDPSNVNGLDRGVIGNDNRSADDVSDIFQFVIPTLAAVGSLLHIKHGWRAVLEDLLIIGESVALAGATRQLTALAIRRPRPFMYVPGLRPESRGKANAAGAFFSGHAAVVFAASLSFTYLHTARNPHMKHKWLWWLGSIAVAAPVPFMRVASGKHFWTDVMAGTAVGTVFGLLVPAIHLATKRSSSETSMFTMSVAPVGNGLGMRGTF